MWRLKPTDEKISWYVQKLIKGIRFTTFKYFQLGFHKRIKSCNEKKNNSMIWIFISEIPSRVINLVHNSEYFHFFSYQWKKKIRKEVKVLGEFYTSVKIELSSQE